MLIKFRSTTLLCLALLAAATAGCAFFEAWQKLRDAEGEKLWKAEVASRPASVEIARLNGDGTLDETFGSGGKLVVDPVVPPQQKNMFLHRALLSFDNKITLQYGGDIYRYDLTGALESRITPESGAGGNTVFLTRIQADNSYLLTAEETKYLASENPDMADARYDYLSIVQTTADGKRDPEFGTGGRIVTELRSQFSQPIGLALLPDGKIMIAGNGYGAPLQVLRFERDGKSDSDFGSHGKVSQPNAPAFHHPASQILLQKDGKFIVVGAFDTVTLLRHNSDGTPDKSFAEGGVLVTDIQRNGSNHAVAFDPRGNLLVGGWASGDYVFRRYTKAGLPDVKFNAGQRMVIEHAALDDLSPERQRTASIWLDLLLQPDGKVLVAITRPCVRECSHPNKLDDGFAIFRYDENGVPDRSFGGHGSVSGRGHLNNVLLSGDGKVFLAGTLVDINR